MIDLLLDGAACYRITRLLTRDRLTRPWRARLIAAAYMDDTPGESDAWWESRVRADDDAPTLAAFLICPACVSVWIGFGVIAARKFVPRAWDPIARALTCASIGTFLSHLDRG